MSNQHIWVKVNLSDAIRMLNDHERVEWATALLETISKEETIGAMRDLVNNSQWNDQVSIAPRLPSAAQDGLKKEIAQIVNDAFTAGFDADNAGALDHFEGFALAEAAIEKYWPNQNVISG